MTAPGLDLPDTARAYLGEVQQALAFDPELATQVTTELQDHFSEALERKGAIDDGLLRGFGPPRHYAQAMTHAQAPRQLRASAGLMFTALLLIILTMNLRSAVLPEGGLDGRLSLAHWLDHYCLIVAFAGAVLTLVAARRLGRGQSFPPWLPPRLLPSLTLIALLLSCAGGAVLTWAALAMIAPSAFAAPLLTTAAEMVALALLAADQRRLFYYLRPKR